MYLVGSNLELCESFSLFLLDCGVFISKHPAQQLKKNSLWNLSERSCIGNCVQRASEVDKPVGRCGRNLNYNVTLERSKVRCSAVRKLVMDWWPAGARWFWLGGGNHYLIIAFPTERDLKTLVPILWNDQQMQQCAVSLFFLQVDLQKNKLTAHCCICWSFHRILRCTE